MDYSLKHIISNYYSELQRAFKTRRLDSAKLHLHKDVAVIGPNEKFEGRESVLEMYGQFVQIVGSFDIKRQYFDHESSCTVLDCVMRSPPVPIATIEWILVKNGEIIEIHPVYDTLAWEKIMKGQS